MATQTTAPLAAKIADPALTERLRLEVERAVQRSFKSLELLGAPPPVVGRTPKRVLHSRGKYLLIRTRLATGWVDREKFGLICPK